MYSICKKLSNYCTMNTILTGDMNKNVFFSRKINLQDISNSRGLEVSDTTILF